MFDFSHIAPVKQVPLQLGIRLRPTDAESIVLQVRYAGDGNPGYLSARDKTPMPPDEPGRLVRLAKLLGRHAIVSWNLTTDGGEPLAFTPELGEHVLLALLEAKRSDVVQFIRIFCFDASNFHEPLPDPVALGKG